MEGILECDYIESHERRAQKRGERQEFVVIEATAALLAHEIANPLNGMYTSVQLLERHLAKQQQAPDAVLTSTVQDLTCEIRRLRTLLQDFRSLARPTKLDAHPTNLKDVTAETLALEAPRYEHSGIKLRLDFNPNLPLIMGDAVQLKQLLLNLCKNAAEAMTEGGQLTVRGHTRAGEVILEVADTGMGIPDGVNIFELFITTKTEGTGLGLAIARQIALAHGAKITCTSERKKGTTFRIAFPSVALCQPEEKTRAKA